MRSPFAYVASGGRLQRASIPAAVLYLGAMNAAALLSDNPVFIAGIGLCAVGAGIAAGAGRALRRAARMGLTLGVLLALLNALLAGRGETMLIRVANLAWPGRVDVTLEALYAGALIGLRVFVVLLVFAVWSAAVDPDRVRRFLRPVAWRTALTATVAIRLVPVAAADAQRVGEAARLRGPSAAAAGRGALARKLLAGALERAVDVAAALELRGYGLGRPGRNRAGRASIRDGAFAASGATILALAVAQRIAGVGSSDPYPTIAVELGLEVWLAALAAPVLALAPFSRWSWRRHSPRRDTFEVARA